MIDPGASAPPASGGRMTMRALLLRCPRCGGRGIWRSYFRMRPICPICGLVLDRGESEDYWLGAYMFNLVAAELVAIAISVSVIVVSWPDVPWGVVQYGGVALAVLVPILFFPFSRVLWLTWDFMFRPNRD